MEFNSRILYIPNLKSLFAIFCYLIPLLNKSRNGSLKYAIQKIINGSFGTNMNDYMHREKQST